MQLYNFYKIFDGFSILISGVLPSINGVTVNAAKIMENCDNSILASTINTKTSSNEKTKCYANFRMEKILEIKINTTLTF